MKLVLIIALLVALAVALVILLRPAGPRITTIEHRRDDEDEEDRG